MVCTIQQSMASNMLRSIFNRCKAVCNRGYTMQSSRCCATPVEDALGVLGPLLAEHDELLPVVPGPLLEDLDEPVVDLLVLS
jgi:hypothetical protein